MPFAPQVAWMRACKRAALDAARIVPGEPTPLRLFTHYFAKRPTRSFGDRTDERVALIMKTAGEADTIADQWDAAANVDAARAAKDQYDAKRKDLYKALADLVDTQFWRVSSWRWWRNKLEECGCGLLDARTWIYQRDLTLYGVYLQLYGRLDQPSRDALVWRTEAYCFVFPERGPLPALLEAASGLQEPPTEAAWAALVATLGNDDYWFPEGSKSLDKLRSQVAPPANPRGADGDRADQPMNEAQARGILDQCGWSWTNVQQRLFVGGDRGDTKDHATLQKLSDFRRTLTEELMRQAASGAKQEHGAEFQPFRWVRYAIPGSQRLTSDIDVNMRGSATEKVVQVFNALFRQWTRNGNPRPTVELESGYVFDVNVYAQDYTLEPGRRFLSVDKPDLDIWPPRNSCEFADAQTWQDKYALMKMRLHMPADAWQPFRHDLLTEPLLTARATVLQALLDDVDGLLNEETAARQQALDAVAQQFANYPGHAEIRAQNNRYEAQLDVVYQLRQQLQRDATDRARQVALAAALGKAMSLAQEAYHSSGAVRDVVCNLQMGQGLELDMRERLNSFNEQVGDIWKDLNHMQPPPQGEVSIQFAVEASKYLFRMARAAVGASADVISAILAAVVDAEPDAPRQAILQHPQAVLNRLLDLQELVTYWQSAMQFFLRVKDKPEAFKDATGGWTLEVRINLGRAPWNTTALSSFRTCLRDLTREVNVYVRASADLKRGVEAVQEPARALVHDAAPRIASSSLSPTAQQVGHAL